MGASHRLAGSYISLNTRLPSEKLLDICEDIADEVFRRREDRPGSVRLDDRTTDMCRFTVLGGFRKPVMRFVVVAGESNRDEGTDLVTEIKYFTTLQEQLFGFIPAGSKQLNGWPSYSTFMYVLQDVVGELDPDADVAIVEEWGG